MIEVKYFIKRFMRAMESLAEAMQKMIEQIKMLLEVY